jgi:hypothetical protein
MIRPFTCLCLLMSAGSGLYLYTVKHDAQMLDRDISRLSRQAQDHRARAALMRAEYDRLGDPDRLRELASQVLNLQPTDPQQFSSLADLDKRLQLASAAVQVNIGMPPEPLTLMASAAETVTKPPVAQIATATIPAPGVSLPVASLPVSALPEKPVMERPQIASVAIARPIPPVRVVTPVVVAIPQTIAPIAPTPPPSMLASAQQPAMISPPRVPLVRQASAAEPRPTPLRPPASVPSSEPVSRNVRPPASVEPPAPVYASALGMARTSVLAPGVSTLTPTSFAPSALGAVRR